MKCQRYEVGGRLCDRWHWLWCAECRADHRADDLIACAISQMQAEPVPTGGLRQALETIEAQGSQRRASVAFPSRRRAPAAIRGILLAAQAIFVGIVLVMAITGWRHRGGDLSLTGAAKPTSEIRTVHFVAEEFIGGVPRRMETWIKYPDKSRAEFEGRGTAIINGRRFLQISTWGKRNEATVSYDGQRRMGRADAFTEAGVRRMLKSPQPLRVKVVRDSIEREASGKSFVVIEFVADYPGGEQIDGRRVRADRGSGRIVGSEDWHQRKRDGKITYRMRVDRIEYNMDLPDSLFSTEPPKGAIVRRGR